LPRGVLASDEEVKYTVESMQNIPDSLTGFQPDMDPDLREVLETLENEDDNPKEEVSDEEDPEDIFAALVQSGVVPQKPTSTPYDEDYESDDTVKGHDITGSEYLKEMAQYKTPSKPQDDTSSLADLETASLASRASTANTHRTSKQRRKRRQRLGGAYSETGTDFSMTSSANFRSEGLTTLDDRFDRILEEYNEDEEGEGTPAGPVHGKSKEWADFDSILDEFLGGYKVLGKKMVRDTTGGGMKELDDVRRQLGKARIS
jgi:protein LTV1